ncbi:hypothetical protein OG946_12525 [Streptomyces sp. NBC_01808]|uniref:hypothetical protein n=1 Tax=Streptomyces sp. NBC_01808 TaxID=2975947 RepID=UPI002DDBA067|nr:hypothetical protein [Streptomyces sp. NBC_01808]WSA38122.1 hypothetical protein OG946_12525 [Streptomyces sp. NBC_01808]
MRAAAGCLDAEHLTVLDGRTLNVCVRLPEDGAGRSGAWLRAGGRALPLEVAGERAFGTYVVEPGVPEGAGMRRRRAAGAGHGLDVIAVREGEARELGVELAVGGRRRRGYGLRAPGDGVPVASPGAGSAAGPTLLDPPHPDGWRITVAASGDGCAVVLRAVRLPPHAEVERVEVGWTELAVHGRVVGPADTPPAWRWPVRLPRSRGAEDARRGPAGPAPGGEFACELVGRGEAGGVCALPVADRGGGRFVARAGGAELTRVAGWGGERAWDVRVRAAGCAVALPVGRLLGDVVDPGRVHRLPNRLLIADSGDVVRVAPRYTAAGRLVVVTEVVGHAGETR